MTLQDMRRNYQRGSLHEADVASDPMMQFDAWFKAIAAERATGRTPDWFEPNAMTLATATPEGVPSARIVLLKGYDGRHFTFFTNYASQKGSELTANPQAELCFFWAPLERQVRVHGRVARLPRAESAAYFCTRPRGSQLGACVSQQSATIADRSVLEDHLRELEKRYAGGDVPMPETWGGFALTPEHVEFWQGQPNRLHDRLRYSRQADGAWKIERLAP